MKYTVEYVFFVNHVRYQPACHIGKRLKEYRTKHNVKMPEIARATGIHAGKLYRWEKGTRPRNWVQYRVLTHYLDEKEYSGYPWSSNEEDVLYYGPPARTRIRMVHQQPLLNSSNSTSWGFTSILDDGEPFLFGDYIHVPRLHWNDHIMTLADDSMSPTFEKASKIIIKKIENPVLLVWGRPYFIIDKNRQGILRRIMPGNTSEEIMLVADNPKRGLYVPIIRRHDKIMAILNVKSYMPGPSKP